MHEHSPRMSVAQGLVASTSQAKSEIIIEVPRYEMIAEEPKETENLDMDLKIAYVNPTSGTYKDVLLELKLHIDMHSLFVFILFGVNCSKRVGCELFLNPNFLTTQTRIPENFLLYRLRR